MPESPSDPLQDWQGPVNVVSRVDVSNGVGGNANSTYAYAGARIDLSGRGLLPFRQTNDAFGNKLTSTASGADIATRAASATYDSQGRFVTSATNAMGRRESREYDPRFGKPTSHTGPNGLTTTWSHDSFGRKIVEVRPDGTQTKWSYQFCNGVNGGTASCVPGAIYLVQAIPLAADGTTPNGPTGIVYRDSLERDIASDTQGFDGSTVRTSKQYDSLGRVQQQSRPYFASGGTAQWTIFTYDVLGRVLTEKAPDTSVTQYAYHGLVSTVTNALSQTRTVRKDSQGHVVAITDAPNNTVSYVYQRSYTYDALTRPAQVAITIAGTVYTMSGAYDANGRLSTVTYPSGFTVSYTRTSLGDVSALANAVDAELRITQQTAGNGVVTQQGLIRRPDACSASRPARAAASQLLLYLRCDRQPADPRGRQHRAFRDPGP